MMMPIPRGVSRLLTPLLLLSLAVTGIGCLAVAAGAAGGAAVSYAYLRGRVYDTYTAGFDDAWAATQTAVKELGMPITTEERKGTTGHMESQTGDHEAVSIDVETIASKIPACPR